MQELDPNLLALMNQTVLWERCTGLDAYTDYQYAVSKKKKAWVEERGASGGVDVVQRPDETVYHTILDLFFDATDPDVQAFSMKDRFTIAAIEDDQVRADQPQRIQTFYGPDGEPWVKMVTM